jgi:hypothetical protein
MKGEQVSEAWVGRRVKVKLRTESGNGYWVLGRLRGVSDERIELSPQFRKVGRGRSVPDPTLGRPYRTYSL